MWSTPLGRRAVAMASSGTLIVAALLAGLLGAPASLGNILLITASVIAGTPIAVRAWQALRVRTWSIDLLVTIAVLGGIAIGDYFESSVVAFLFLFGAWLEGRTLAKARRSIQGLIDLSPTTAIIEKDGQRVRVDADDLDVDDLVIVTTGERIAAEGATVSGTATTNAASITGESVAAFKEPGDTVHASTIVEAGYLEVRATEVGDETTFGRIVELVEESLESRTRGAQFLERFARYYTPGILIAAVVLFIFTRDIEKALVFLVIACPGALVISVPVAAVAGLGNVARNGVLIKNGEALEALARANTLAVDKTGTITFGKPKVTLVESFDSRDEDELLTLAAAVETSSEHHLGRAVVEEATERGLVWDDPQNVDVVSGRGISATTSNRRVQVGNATYLAGEGIHLTPTEEKRVLELEERGQTVLLIAIDAGFAGLIAVADRIRPQVSEAVAALRNSGLKEVVLLTGDNEGAARAIAEEAGITQWQARMLPHDKAEFVTRLQAEGRRVAMVGDGVNDAPALATAEVGIAMGQSGTDISMETAGVVLLNDRLDQLAHASRVSRATLRIMKQNTALALGTVAILIAAVLYGSLGLAGGMFVHEVSVLLVILNALRLTRYRGPHLQEGRVRQSRKELVA